MLILPKDEHSTKSWCAASYENGFSFFLKSNVGSFVCLVLRFHLFIHETHRERERQRYRQGEKQAPCREPDVGLNLGTLGSCPEPKADA